MAKTMTTTYTLFEKGDFVRTPGGVAKVVEDQEVPRDGKALMYADVKVVYKYETEEHTVVGEEILVDYAALQQISEDDYNAEKYW